MLTPPIESYVPSSVVVGASYVGWMWKFEICKPVLGEAPEPRTAPYMTDAANLLKVYAGAPTVVLGPGEAAMAHQTDEYCSIERIRQSVGLYESIIEDWVEK